MVSVTLLSFSFILIPLFVLIVHFKGIPNYIPILIDIDGNKFVSMRDLSILDLRLPVMGILLVLFYKTIWSVKIPDEKEKTHKFLWSTIALLGSFKIGIKLIEIILLRNLETLFLVRNISRYIFIFGILLIFFEILLLCKNGFPLSDYVNGISKRIIPIVAILIACLGIAFLPMFFK